MKKLKPHNPKFFSMYMNIAQVVANESVANTIKVGACVVTQKGVIGVGLNGTPSGFDNACEWSCEDGMGYETGRTKPEVIHAERNALDKMTLQGISTEYAILFTTTAPCFECAKSIAAVGITAVYYKNRYKCDSGIEHLNKVGVICEQLKENL